MKLAMYKGSGTFYDKVIRQVTNSPYSHCELLIGNVCYSSSPRDGGVRMKIIDLNDGKWDLYTVPGNEHYAFNWFVNNTKKKYDWLGAITTVLPFQLNIPNRFFCSEACALMLQTPVDTRRVTPKSLLEQYT